MKLIHTSDWHIGRTLRSYTREDDHRYFIGQLCCIMADETPDALLVSGDVYDNPVPSISAQNAFVQSILDLHAASPDTAIIITGGNHDSGIRLNVHRPVWEAHNVSIIGSDVRSESGGNIDFGQFIIKLPGKGMVLAVPYYHKFNFPAIDEKCAREDRQAAFFKALTNYAHSINIDSLPMAMMAHLAVTGCDTSGHEPISIGGEDSVSANTLGHGVDYIALGHIHMPQWIANDYAATRYSGSPYPMTFAEDYAHSVTLVIIDKHGGTPQSKTIPLNTLHRLITLPETPGNFDDALSALEHLDAEKGSFVRLQVLRSTKLPADADMRAAKTAEIGNYRFCNFLVIDDMPYDETTSLHAISLDQINKTNPVEIARMFYQNTISKDMPQEYVDMLDEIISEVDRDMHNPNMQL